MVVDRDRQDLLGLVLSDDVLIQELPDLLRLQKIDAGDLVQDGIIVLELFLKDPVAEFHTLVTDVKPVRSGQKSLDHVLGLSAERASDPGVAFFTCHTCLSIPFILGAQSALIVSDG